MKKLEIIIRPERLDDLKAILNECDAHGLMITNIMGYGSQKGHKQAYNGVDFGGNLLPKVKVETIVDDDTAEKIIDLVIEEIEKMQRMGLCDVINVYVRGENINKPPVLKYSTTSKTNKYRNFKEAIITERKLQREALLANPTAYLVRIENAKKIIKDNEVNPELTANELKGLDELQQEFIAELGKKIDMDSKEYE